MVHAGEDRSRGRSEQNVRKRHGGFWEGTLVITPYCPIIALELAEAEADSLAMFNPAVDRSRDRLEASETTRTFAKCYSNTVIKLGMTIVLACE
jgi:hypothetical protein